MAKAKKDDLEGLRNAAQYFTMASAILYGLLWVVVGLLDKESANIDTMGDVLILATMVGGITMGLLYLVRSVSKK